MPIKADIDLLNQLTIFTVTGELSLNDFRSTLESVYNGTDAKVTKDILWDLRNASISALSSQDIEMIVNIGSRYWKARKGGKSAIVALEDVSYGISMIYRGQASSFPYKIEVFRTLEEALQWLTEEGEENE